MNGAELLSTGAIKAGKVTAIGNTGGSGLSIDNHYLGSGMPQPATLLGPILLTNNDTDNLDVATWGAITINNLTANNSLTGYGAFLGMSPAMPGNVTLNGVNTFNNNSYGAEIDSEV